MKQILDFKQQPKNVLTDYIEYAEGKIDIGEVPLAFPDWARIEFDEDSPISKSIATPTSKEGLTYKVECLDNSTAHYTHDKKEAYEVYAKFIIDFGDTIRLHEAPMPINDHDEIDWETIECYDVDENESKEGLEDGGFTPGEWEASYNSEEFPGQAAIYGCDGDTNGRVIAVLDTSDQTDMANIDLICAAPIMYDLLKWVVNEIETTPDELSDALLGMIKIKCNQLFTRINKD